jgi:rubrerythrin
MKSNEADEKIKRWFEEINQAAREHNKETRSLTNQTSQVTVTTTCVKVASPNKRRNKTSTWSSIVRTFVS